MHFNTSLDILVCAGVCVCFLYVTGHFGLPMINEPVDPRRCVSVCLSIVCLLFGSRLCLRACVCVYACDRRCVVLGPHDDRSAYGAMTGLSDW